MQSQMMSVDKAEDLEVDYEEVGPKRIQQIHMYQPPFTKHDNCKPATRKQTGCTCRCSIIIAVVLMVLIFLISIVMLPLMAYEIREIRSTFNINFEKQNKSITNHQDQLISDLGSQLTNLINHSNQDQLISDLGSQLTNLINNSNQDLHISDLGSQLITLIKENHSSQNQLVADLGSQLIALIKEDHSNQDQHISELSHQLTSLIEQNSTTQNQLTDLVSQVALLRGDLNESKSLDYASNKLIADIQNFFEFDSCNFLQNFSVQLPSGLYKIMPRDALTPTKAYCSYQSLSGRNEWWRRVAYLNTSESGQVQCPSGLETRRESPSSCRRAVEESGCSSVYFDPGNTPYSRVGGRVRARQSGQPDGFQDFNGPRFRGQVSLEDNYVDGISLTYGDEGNRTHIWTFAASVNTRRDRCAVCDREKPDFIGDHFSCELLEFCYRVVCNSNQLWDGGQCVGGESFFRDLPEPTTEQIEMRVCREQDRLDEDILVTEIELYVQ